MAAQRAPSRARRWLVRAGVIVALGGTVAAGIYLRPRDVIVVRVAHPQSGPVRDVVSSSVAGEVTPELHATVRAEVGGKVLAVRHKAGARVKKSEVVIQLDAADLDARLSQAQAAATASSGQLAQSRARLDTLQRQAERARTLLARGAGTAQLSEDAEAAVREAAEAIKASQGQLQQTQAAAQVARVARGHADITAPFDGVLTDVLPHEGDVLAPTAPVFEIMDDNRLHVDATIDEADAAKVRPGQEAELKLDAMPDQVVRGRVSRVDPAVKRDLKGARTLGVEVEVNDVPEARQKGLKPGMSANVDIVVAEKQDVLYLPSNVIVGRGVSRAVLLLQAEGRYFRVHKTDVRIGLSNWDRTEVLSGVKPGELVAASLNQKGLEDGALVEAQRADKGGP